MTIQRYGRLREGSIECLSAGLEPADCRWLAAVLLAWSDVAEARLDERNVRQHKLSVCETPTEGN